MTPPAADNALARLTYRVLGVDRREYVAVAWSFLYFFCLLASYYMLRSVRETMAIVGGVENIHWLFLGTFVVMLLATPVFGWIASRFPRRAFVPWVYWFFIANILAFFAAFTVLGDQLDRVWVGRTFFVWLSVFNLFVVSVFWSFMVDIYSTEQSRRLFGIISAGGSTGAFLGPLVTSLVVVPIGFENLLPLSALLLGVAVYCIHRLRRWSLRQAAPASGDGATAGSRPLGGSALAGMKLVFTTPYLAAIAAGQSITNILGAVLYVYMAQLVSQHFPVVDEQTRAFALVDTFSNALSFIGQLLVVKHAVQRLGMAGTLAIVPLLSLLGFALLAANPVFIVVAVLQVVRRGFGYGISKPATDMLYSVVSREAKYKAKNFIETAVWRASDLAGVWAQRLVSGIGLAGMSVACLPLAAAWVGLALWIGRDYRRREGTSGQVAYGQA
ncbi:MAG TPA: MFS transporter [Woeseiaceae bacterium]|nr:MFS transporter [Woeseiaceae bacterium]